jgi:hypothetical protein
MLGIIFALNVLKTRKCVWYKKPSIPCRPGTHRSHLACASGEYMCWESWKVRTPEIPDS